MTRRFGFYRDVHGEWYVNLPEWPGDSTGARVRSPDFLEKESGGSNWVRLDFSTENLENGRQLVSVSEGYFLEPETSLEFHLCEAMRYVFDTYPQLLYFR